MLAFHLPRLILLLGSITCLVFSDVALTHVEGILQTIEDDLSKYSIFWAASGPLPPVFYNMVCIILGAVTRPH